MGQDQGSWFPPQRLGSLSPGLNSSFARSHSRHQDTNIVSENLAANMVTVRGTSPVYAQLPLTHVGAGDKSHGLVYGSPNLQSPFTTPQKPCLLFKNQIEAIMPKAGDEYAPKRFLVFDQSGDQTTLIFSSDVSKPFVGLTTGSLKRCGTHDMKKCLLRTNEDLVVHQGVVTKEEFVEKSEPDLQSEMHEDTEELNALLYSDDESEYSDEDEVTSSGHSPGIISAHVNEEASVGSTATDGLSSFVRHSHAAKRKLLEGFDYETLTKLPHGSLNSLKRNRSRSEDDKDAESSCASCGNAGSLDLFLPPNKKIGKEKITETLSVLRSIVPGGEMDDSVFIIDRAIDYLKSLKMKAKTLGLEPFGSLET